MPHGRDVKFQIAFSDVTRYATDALVLKHAQALYGADAVVYDRLQNAGISVSLPDEGEIAVVETTGALAARNVIFLGVQPLFRFGYPNIREFARAAVESVADRVPNAHEIALTIHGPGYGLDDMEAFEAELAGLIDALRTGRTPPQLNRIAFVEHDERRAERLVARLKELLPSGRLAVDKDGRAQQLGKKPRELVASAGVLVPDKPRVFVAMPFRREMEDFFEYGIFRPAKKCGYICERADREIFTDDVVAWVKERIASADLVIADLTTANPNVYLEVGYAWGCGRRTVLLVQNTDELKFDVKTQRCIVYSSIKDLEREISTLLKALLRKG